MVVSLSVERLIRTGDITKIFPKMISKSLNFKQLIFVHKSQKQVPI